MRLTSVVTAIGIFLGVAVARADLPANPFGFHVEAAGGVVGISTPADAERAIRRAQQGDAVAQTQVGMLYGSGRFLPPDPAQSAFWLGKGAAQDLPLAMYELGVLTYRGAGVPKSDSQAVALWRRAAEKGYVPAQATLGGAYAMGVGVARDLDKALGWTRNAADAGDSLAITNLAISYQYGRGVAPDLPRSVGLYQRAAALGNASAQYNLGTLYENGDGVPPDPARAFALYLAAAQQGSADGERAVGMAYRGGLGTQKDAHAAMTWLLRAAAQNDAAAEFYISKAYAAGEGVPPDQQKHFEWQKRAADHGDGFAQLVRGLELSEKPFPSVDFAETARLLTAALAQTDLLLLRSRAKPDPTRFGLALARLTLGMQYAGGLGVPKDDAKAMELMVQAIPDLGNKLSPEVRAYAAEPNRLPADVIWRIRFSLVGTPTDPFTTEDVVRFMYFAAAAGNRDAQFELGRGYLAGQRKPADLDTAHVWIVKAAEQGHAGAQFTLAFELCNGTDGVTSNPPECFRWARRAADSGDTLGEAYLSELYRTGTGVPADAEQFRLWSRKAAEKGLASSQGDLGYALMVGFGGPVDRTEAMMWLLLAQRGAINQNSAKLQANVEANLSRLSSEISPDEIARARARFEIEAAREAAAAH